jgi:5-enolpyruvylshikimate-3-phosphate synthase
MEYRVKRAPRIDAEITLPGDKSISHRAASIGYCSGLSSACDGANA